MGADDGSKRALFEQAARAAADYLDAEAKGPVAPAADLGRCLERLRAFSFDDPVDAPVLVDTLVELGEEFAVRSTGGRYFGFVTGGTEPAALAASTLAGVWDQNSALAAMSPLAAAFDTVAAELIVESLGLPSTATAAFCGGASVANLTAIIAARDALYDAIGWDVAVDGLIGAPDLQVIVSAEIHVSVLKALRLAGIGSASVVTAPVDDCGRIDVTRFPEITGPTLLVAQAGNVNTGHSDPFEDIDYLVPEEWRVGNSLGKSWSSDTPGPVWLHLDGAFGLWAKAAPSHQHLVAGAEKADSWAVDCHKWLNVPYDNGVVVVADGRHLRRAMAADAAYLHGSGQQREPMHLGLQMSQAARGIPVWAALSALGRSGVADLVSRCCRLAERFGQGLEEAGATVLAPVVLNQVLVAFGSAEGGDGDVTDAVLETVASDGVCWMGGTTWQGRRAMRISVSDTATTEDDIDRSLQAVVTAWNSVRG